MQTDVDRVMRNLGVLAAVRPNDKLVTEGDFFTLYTPTTMRAAWRAFYGESRELNLKRITECVRGACAFVSCAAKEAEGRVGCEPPCTTVQQRTRLQTCARVLNALAQSLVGMENLGETYAADAATLVRITNLREEVVDFLETVQQLHNIELPPPPPPTYGELSLSFDSVATQAAM